MDLNVVQIETRIRVGKRAPSTQDSANEAKERGRLRVKKSKDYATSRTKISH